MRRSSSSRELLKCYIRVHCCLPCHVIRSRSIDDVEDGSALRRGFPVAHSIYGTPQTINSANYVYFCALRELERLATPGLFKICSGIHDVIELMQMS
jgi:geranylgeranyl pyrophosphate synthase